MTISPSIARHYMPVASKISKSTLQTGLQKLSSFTNNATLQTHKDSIQKVLHNFSRHIKEGLSDTQLEAAKHQIITKAGGNLSYNDKENIKTVLNVYSKKELDKKATSQKISQLRVAAYGESIAAKQHAQSVGSINKTASQHSAGISDALKKKPIASINAQAASQHTSSISSVRPGGVRPIASVGFRKTGISLVK